MFKEKRISSIDQFLKITLKWSIENCRVLYRGHANAKHSLIPGVGRINEGLEPKRTIPKSDLLDVEKQIFADFQVFGNRQIRAFIEPTSENKLEVLCLAQHYGLPTRLLDWTSNALAALFFAASDAEKMGEEFCVWAYCLEVNDRALITQESHPQIKKDPFSTTGTYFFKPTTVTERIHVQAGWFSIHHFEGKKEGFKAMETNSEFRKELAKLIFPKSSAALILRHLNSLHVNFSTLFPDMNGTSQHLKWRTLNEFLHQDEFRRKETEVQSLLRLPLTQE